MNMKINVYKIIISNFNKIRTRKYSAAFNEKVKIDTYCSANQFKLDFKFKHLE